MLRPSHFFTSFQVDAIAEVVGQPQNGCVSLSVKVDAAAYMWGRLRITLWRVDLVNSQSDVMTLFNSLGGFELLNIPCISTQDALSSNCPFAVERAVQNTQKAVLTVMGAKGIELATLTINRVLDPQYSNKLPSASNFAASTQTVRVEAQGSPASILLGANRKFLPISTTVKLTPASAQIPNGAVLVLRVLSQADTAAPGTRRAAADSGVDPCKTLQAQVQSVADPSSPWMSVPTSSLDCSRCISYHLVEGVMFASIEDDSSLCACRYPDVSLSINSFAAYRIVTVQCCGEGQYGNCSACFNCTTCGAGTYIASACSSSKDTICTPCKSCGPGAYAMKSCLGNGTVDAVQCACNDMFYGDGNTCTPCDICSPLAVEPTYCGGMQMPCRCKNGYFGDGKQCTPCTTKCPAGTHTVSECSISQDRVCKPCLKCQKGQYNPSCKDSPPGPGQCMLCKVCDSNAMEEDMCNGNATVQNKCTCKPGYYGDGEVCNKCTPGPCPVGTYLSQECSSTSDKVCLDCSVCDSHADVSGSCPGPQGNTNVVCNCRDNYYNYNNGCLECSAFTCPEGFYKSPCTATSDMMCKSCSECSLNADVLRSCGAVDDTADVLCTCRNGFYGDGLQCTQCKQGPCPEGSYQKSPCNATANMVCAHCSVCDNNADASGSCPAGSTTDVTCTCRDNFYGDGTKCSPCTVCSQRGAITSKACAAHSDATCKCDSGHYFGNGPGGYSCIPCTPCPAGWYLQRECNSTVDNVCSKMTTSAVITSSKVTVTTTVTAATTVVHLVLGFDVPLAYFNEAEQLNLKESLALAAGLSRADAQLVTLHLRAVDVQRRAATRVEVDAYIACQDGSAAAAVAAALSPSRIGDQLRATGLPPAQILLSPELQPQAREDPSSLIFWPAFSQAAKDQGQVRYRFIVRSRACNQEGIVCQI
jgi:hypothetical protein